MQPLSLLILTVFFIAVCTCLSTTAKSKHKCYSCNNVLSPLDCETTIECSPDESCFATHHKGTDGKTYYHLGCIQDHRCGHAFRHTARKSYFSHGKVHTYDEILCGWCCTSNLCNRYICGHVPPPSHTSGTIRPQPATQKRNPSTTVTTEMTTVDSQTTALRTVRTTTPTISTTRTMQPTTTQTNPTSTTTTTTRRTNPTSTTTTTAQPTTTTTARRTPRLTTVESTTPETTKRSTAIKAETTTVPSTASKTSATTNFVVSKETVMEPRTTHSPYMFVSRVCHDCGDESSMRSCNANDIDNAVLCPFRQTTCYEHRVGDSNGRQYVFKGCLNRNVCSTSVNMNGIECSKIHNGHQVTGEYSCFRCCEEDRCN